MKNIDAFIASWGWSLIILSILYVRTLDDGDMMVILGSIVMVILGSIVTMAFTKLFTKLKRTYRIFKVLKTLDKIGRTPIFTSLDKENKTVIVTLMRPSKKVQKEIESLKLKDSISARKFLKGKRCLD